MNRLVYSTLYEAVELAGLCMKAYIPCIVLKNMYMLSVLFTHLKNGCLQQLWGQWLQNMALDLYLTCLPEEAKRADVATTLYFAGEKASFLKLHVSMWGVHLTVDLFSLTVTCNGLGGEQTGDNQLAAVCIVWLDTNSPICVEKQMRLVIPVLACWCQWFHWNAAHGRELVYLSVQIWLCKFM